MEKVEALLNSIAFDNQLTDAGQYDFPYRD
jgi:hypothetical protein